MEPSAFRNVTVIVGILFINQLSFWIIGMVTKLSFWSSWPSFLSGPRDQAFFQVLVTKLFFWSSWPSFLSGPRDQAFFLVLVTKLSFWSSWPSFLSGPRDQAFFLVLMEDEQALVNDPDFVSSGKWAAWTAPEIHNTLFIPLRELNPIHPTEFALGHQHRSQSVRLSPEATCSAFRYVCSVPWRILTVFSAGKASTVLCVRTQLCPLFIHTKKLCTYRGEAEKAAAA